MTAERARPASAKDRSKGAGKPRARSRSGGNGRRADAGEEGRPKRSAKPSPDLRILESRVYRGPNYWSYDPAIRLLVDLGSLEEWPSNTIPDFTERLKELLPGLVDHACSLGRKGGFLSRLDEGTWLGHVAEHVALELQRESGTEIRRGKTRSADRPGHYNVIYGYSEESVGLAAGQLAVRLVNHLVRTEKGFDFAAELEGLIRLAERAAFGPSTQAIVDEAAANDIPVIRLNEQSLVQLGQGVYQHRIRATMTSATPALAVDIAGDKKLTNALLAAAGLPVPRSQVVTSADDAVRAARRIGFPVVTKPLDGNHGRGVSLELRTDAAVRKGFALAEPEARRERVVVESYVAGNDYRVLVVGGVMAAIAQRVPAHVIGDGRQTVAELVEETNADPRRGIGHEKVLTKIKVDAASIELVKSEGYSMDDVPPEGEMVKLKLTGNMSTGGISIDRTYEAHPDNVEIAEEAARVVGLDVAGIDFITPDISQPVRETGGAIVEVNAAPGFRMHTHPTEGEPQFVAKPVIELLFPKGSPSRIPIVAVTGSNGKTTTVRMIAHIFRGMGRKVGLTSTDGIYIDERLVKKADASGPKSAQMVLQNPRVDFAVFEVARGGILREGLGYGRNDVAVVLNVTGDHLGLGDVQSIRQLAAVKRVIVEAVPRDGFAVLNADDPLVADMRKHSSGGLVLFSMERDNELVERSVRRGGKAVVLGDGTHGEMIVIRDGRRTMPLAYTHLLPATFGGRARMNVQNALAATAAAYAAGAHLHDIRQGLRTFTTSYYQAPGRLNFLEMDGVKVIVDYAHNPAAMEALGQFVQGMTAGGGEWQARVRLGVIATPGDRRDDDMRALGAAAAKHFDELIVREDRNPRGRKKGETADLVVDGVLAAMRSGARAGAVEVILEEMDAVRAAMDRARPGDVVVLCIDYAADVWRELQERMEHSKEVVGAIPPGAAVFGDGQGATGDPDVVDLSVPGA